MDPPSVWCCCALTSGIDAKTSWLFHMMKKGNKCPIAKSRKTCGGTPLEVVDLKCIPFPQESPRKCPISTKMSRLSPNKTVAVAIWLDVSFECWRWPFLLCLPFTHLPFFLTSSCTKILTMDPPLTPGVRWLWVAQAETSSELMASIGKLLMASFGS